MTHGYLRGAQSPARAHLIIRAAEKFDPEGFRQATNKVRAEKGRVGGQERYAVLEEYCRIHKISLDAKSGRGLAAKLKEAPERTKAEEKWRRHVTGDAFLNSFEWRKVRMEVLKRDGAVCACCGATRADGVRLHVDHIKPRKLFPHLALTLENLQVLCEECNHGKGNWDMTDWREKNKAEGEHV